MPRQSSGRKVPKKGNDPKCMEYESKYRFCLPKNVTLEDLINNVMVQVKEKGGYSTTTIDVFARIMKRLTKLASKMGTAYYTEELRDCFLESGKYYLNDSDFCKCRYEIHRRIIHFFDSYIASGNVDFGLTIRRPNYSIQYEDLQKSYEMFAFYISHLSENTKSGYKRIVRYFLDYLVCDKSYTCLHDIQKGDVSEFIPKVVNEHYRTGISAVLSGLRLFLSIEEFNISTSIQAEVPRRIAKPKAIINPLTDEELATVGKVLDEYESKGITLRNRAICEIANGTGFRAVDIVGLTFANLDWDRNVIKISQHKTGKYLEYPMSASIGNAIVDYLLEERPSSEDQHIFLSSSAPHAPLISHAGIRRIIKGIMESAHVYREKNIGTRLTRHSRATFLLRKGVPIDQIAESIGHNGLNTASVYLSADKEKMIECILPLP